MAFAWGKTPKITAPFLLRRSLMVTVSSAPVGAVAGAGVLSLAKKASSVRSGAVLPAWLISTTRFAASSARALESRRRQHEHKAAAMASQLADAGDDVADPIFFDEKLAPSLDEALAK